MKHIMSINYKFMSLTPKELVNISNEVDGYEIYIDYNKENEINYLKAIAHECKINNKHFQVHANTTLPIDKQIEYMKLLEDISSNLGYKINIVLHSIYDEDKDISKNKTIDYITELSNSVNNNLIQLTLENLNVDNYLDRLNKDEVMPLICNNENIYFTYDIGHEIDDNGNLIDLDDFIIPLIKNIHIHTYDNRYDEGFDHKPIYKGDPHWNQILKSLLFLKSINYSGPVVYEYALYSCPGDTIEEKVRSYVESMLFIKEHLN